MQETRRWTIQQRVFDKAAIRRLAAAIEHAEHEAQAAGLRAETTYEIVSADGTSYESSSSNEVFEDDSVIDLLPTRTLSVVFRGWRNSSPYGVARLIQIQLTHGRQTGDLVVRGDDHHWVAAAFNGIKEVISTASPQDAVFLRHPKLFLHVAAVICGYAVNTILHPVFVVFRGPVAPAPPEWLKHAGDFLKQNPAMIPVIIPVVFIGALWLQGVWVALLLRDYLERLWPSIELDIGPEHLRVERRRRAGLTFMATAVLLPIVISVAYDAMKWWAGPRS